LLKGAGTGALSVASAADIVGQISTTAVTNATNATNATTAAAATSLVTANFSVVESGGKLYFKYGATNIASLDSSGNFVSLANVTAYGTP
jgi:precorrin-6B methylase 2